MELANNNNKLLWYLIVLLVFFVLVFFTRPFLFALQENSDEKTSNEQELRKLEQELSELNELKRNFASNQDEVLKNISKYTVDFSSDALFNYIYSYVDSVNSGGRDTIVMRSLNLSEGVISDLGMHEATITISANFSSQRTLLAFLNYLISADSAYTFYLDNFNYADFGKSGPFQVSIPLKMYYKQ